MKRAHSMPFGAERFDGATRFSLWAPGCSEVALELEKDAKRTVAMSGAGDGWFSTTLDRIAPGPAHAYRVDAGAAVPDPASRFNPWDVNGPSVVVDPRAFDWPDDGWRGRPWREAVVYEVHVGTFTPEGTYAAAIGKLDHVADAGITAIELMPLADFAGRRNWGYDGVLPFAPDAAYGTPEDLKRLVAAAHARGLMVLLDVVYNHFGPEGNHLARYAPQFFNPARQTPWGSAINYDGVLSKTVRDFFIHNALYWIVEFHLDGLRLDAVHAIADDSATHIVSDIARALANGPGAERAVHLAIENDRNEAHFLERAAGVPHATAQWNDDWHHAAHVLATGERDGYYADYAPRPAWYLARALAEGFAYQGEPSPHRNGEPRGERSAHLPPEAFVPFLQNHDQVGNRALGERLTALAPPEALCLATATLLLAPSAPLLFMGEEFGARTPFLYFCDFAGELADAVRDGRRKEFAAFERFADPAARAAIPDPNDERTFLASKLPWSDAANPAHVEALARHRALLQLRREFIAPRLEGAKHAARFEVWEPGAIAVDWTLGDGSVLHLRANFSAADAPEVARARGAVLHTEGDCGAARGLPPWGGVWTLEPA
jgi:malto-oligosyltrehalose trehalohydrolase